MTAGNDTGAHAFVSLRYTMPGAPLQQITVARAMLTTARGGASAGGSAPTAPMERRAAGAGLLPLDEDGLWLRPVAETEHDDPFSTEGFRAQLAELVTANGAAHPLCGRQILKRLAATSPLRISARLRFHLFDDVRFDDHHVQISGSEAPWLSGQAFAQGNLGLRPSMAAPRVLAPQDGASGFRADVTVAAARAGLSLGRVAHGIAPMQHEVHLSPAAPLALADQLVKLRPVLREVAASFGQSACFLMHPFTAAAPADLRLSVEGWQGPDGLPAWWHALARPSANAHRDAPLALTLEDGTLSLAGIDGLADPYALLSGLSLAVSAGTGEPAPNNFRATTRALIAYRDGLSDQAGFTNAYLDALIRAQREAQAALSRNVPPLDYQLYYNG